MLASLFSAKAVAPSCYTITAYGSLEPSLIAKAWTEVYLDINSNQWRRIGVMLNTSVSGSWDIVIREYRSTGNTIGEHLANTYEFLNQSNIPGPNNAVVTRNVPLCSATADKRITLYIDIWPAGQNRQNNPPTQNYIRTERP